MRNVKEVQMTGKQSIPNNRFRLQIVYAVKYMDYWRKNIDSYGRHARFKIEIYQYVELWTGELVYKWSKIIDRHSLPNK